MKSLAVLALLALTNACVPADVIPDPSPRIQPALVHGQLGFARDGKVYPPAPSGLMPLDLVRGDREAEALMDRGNNFFVGTWVLSLIGLAAACASLFTIQDETGETFLAVDGAALGLEIAAVVTGGVGRNSQLESIERFNAGVAAPVVARPAR